MNYAQYTKAAFATLKRLESPQADLDHMNLGYMTEAGELGDAFKRFAVYGKPLDFLNLVEEIGDCCWYLAVTLTLVGIDPDEVEEYMVDWEEQNQTKHGYNDMLRMLSGSVAMFYHMPLQMLVEDYAKAGIFGESVNKLIDNFCLMQGFARWFAQVDISLAFDVNIVKLNAKRYAKGFSDHAAQFRDLGGEREAMQAAYEGRFDMTPWITSDEQG